MSYRDPILALIQDMLEKDGPTDLRGRYVLGQLSYEPSAFPICYIFNSSVLASRLESGGGNVDPTAAIGIQLQVATGLLTESTDENVGHGNDLMELIAPIGEDFRFKDDGILKVLMMDRTLGDPENIFIQIKTTKHSSIANQT